MAQIIINSKESPEFSNVSQLDTIIEKLTSLSNGDQKFITDVSINGKKIDLLEDNLKINLLEGDKVILKAVNSLELAFDVIESSSRYIEIIIKKINEVVNFLAAENLSEANNSLTDVIDLVDVFTQLMSKTVSSLKEHQLIDTEIQELIVKTESHLLMVLKGLLNAKELNNSSMLCDLLQYELIDNLAKWKVQIFTKIKSRYMARI